MKTLNDQSGFVVGPLVYALGLVALVGGVGTYGIMSLLQSSVTISRDTATEQRLTSGSRAVAIESVLCTGAGEVVNGTTCATAGYTPPLPDAFPGSDPALPTNANTTFMGSQAGILPSSTVAPKADAWGKLFAYCEGDSTALTGTTATIASEPAYAIVSAGPDITINTTCAEALADTPQNDDKIRRVVVADAMDLATAWNKKSESELTFGAASPSTARVGIGTDTPAEQLDVNGNANVSGNLTVSGGTSMTGDITTDGNITTTTGNIQATTGDVSAVNVAASSNVSANSVTAGSVGVSGAVSANSLALTNDLPVSEGGTGASDAATARTNLGATPTGDALFTAADAPSARTTLGLGGMALQDPAAVAIGGLTSLDIDDAVGTDIAVADGGTGASTPAAARINLGANNAANLDTGTLPAGRLPAFSGDVSSAVGSSSLTVTGLRSRDVASTAPSSGDSLIWNGANWAPGTPASAGSATSAGNADTVDGIHASQFLRSDTSDTMNGTLTAAGELRSTGSNQARFVSGNYGVIHRNDGVNYYVLLTDSGDQYGGWNTLRPFAVNLASGSVHMSHNVAISNSTWGGSHLDIRGSHPAIHFEDTEATTDAFAGVNAGNFYILKDSDKDGSFEGTYPLLLSLDTDDLQVHGNTVWHSGNSGSGSGSNSDQLDGLDSTDFLRSNADSIYNSFNDAAGLYVTRGGSTVNEYMRMSIIDSGPKFEVSNDESATSVQWNLVATDTEVNGGAAANSGTVSFGTSAAYGTAINIDGTNTVFHEGNDGSGSGLDADLLDGLSSGQFLRSDVSDIMTGDLTVDRLRVTATDDVTLGSTTHSVEVGDGATYHLRIDGNEIQAMNGSGASGIMMNAEGGGINLGHTMYVSAGSGQVSIGSLTPQQSLTIRSPALLDTASVSGQSRSVIHATVDPSLGGAADGAYGGSISFSGLGNERRRSAIANVQTGLDVSYGGLAFFTSRGGTISDETVQETVRITDNGDLILLGKSTGTYNFHTRWPSIQEPRIELDSPGGPGAILQVNGWEGAYRMAVQDGNGRVSHLWNAYSDGPSHRFDKSSEGAAWLLMSDSGFAFRSATGGTSGSTIPWNLGLRQDGTGRVGIGTDVPAYPLDVNGAVRATQVIYTSDRRRKDISGEINGRDALDALRVAAPVRFQYKDDAKKTQRLGFIAQDVEASFPELVTETDEGEKALDYPGMTAPIAAAVLELEDQITWLQAIILLFALSQAATIAAVIALMRSRKPTLG